MCVVVEREPHKFVSTHEFLLKHHLFLDLPLLFVQHSLSVPALGSLVVLQLVPLGDTVIPFLVLHGQLTLSQADGLHVAVLIQIDEGPLQSLMGQHKLFAFIKAL